jgi:hypothetical protein
MQWQELAKLREESASDFVGREQSCTSRTFSGTSSVFSEKQVSHVKKYSMQFAPDFQGSFAVQSTESESCSGAELSLLPCFAAREQTSCILLDILCTKAHCKPTSKWPAIA